MPLDPELVAETKAWFQRADQDLGAGQLSVSADPPFTGDASFHAQQAAEKVMKGFLTWNSRIFGKTHDLTELGRMCVEVDGALEPLLRRAAVLTDFAWKYRYPGAPPDPPRGEAEAALELARNVYDAILGRLPDAVRP